MIGDVADFRKRFRAIRRSYIGFWIFALMTLASLFANVIANDRPLLLKLGDRLYVPFLVTYVGTDFPFESPLEPHYKDLELAEHDWVIWPPIRWGFNENDRSLARYPAPPGENHLLGTDDRGRDLLVRLIYGYRVSVLFGLANLLVAIFMAVLIGGFQGFWGGWIDLLGQRVVEIWNALPYLYVLLLVVSLFEPSVFILVIANGVFAWISLSYYVRAEFLKLRKMDFVTAARALGVPVSRVVGSHIFPNALGPILTFTPFIVSLAIVNLAILDYLGLGVPAPTASLGELLRQGRENFLSSWWLAVFPFGVLVSLTICLNFIGEGLREIFDPKA